MAAKRFLDAREEPTRTLMPLEGYEKKDLVSLEDAVKSIDVSIHNLDTMVWTAKRNSRNPSDGLTPDESAAIGLYTMELPEGYENFYTLLNQKLRSEERKCLKSWFSYLKLFLTALYKLPSIKKTIWRGICGNVNDLYIEDFIWWGISSCTTTIESMERFIGRSGERTLFMIECTNGKSIKAHSSHQDENEILLMPGTYLTVTGKWSPSENVHIIHLQEDNPPHQLLKSPFHLSSSSVDMPFLDKLDNSKSALPKKQAATVPSHEIKVPMKNTSQTNRRTDEHDILQVNDQGKSEAIEFIREQHDNEKHKLIELNYKFSAFLDCAKYLEQKNKELQNTLDELRSQSDSDLDKLKSQYEPQLNNLRETSLSFILDKTKAEIRLEKAEFDLIYYKKSIDDLSEDTLQINSLESTPEQDRKELKYLQRQ